MINFPLINNSSNAIRGHRSLYQWREIESKPHDALEADPDICRLSPAVRWAGRIGLSLHRDQLRERIETSHATKRPYLHK